MELHSMANASSFSGDSSTFMNNDDETKKLIESEEEEQEQSTDEIKIMIESVEEKLNKVSSSRSRCHIYPVARMLYEQKPDVYRPRLVSIGLLHHNDEHLWITETVKLQYLDRLLNRCRKTFEFCVKALNCLEEEARKCYYSDTMNIGKGEFVKMMVIDSCFVLEFLDIMKTGENSHLVLDASWAAEISMDMVMFENQLPFPVLKHLDFLLFNRDHEFSFSYYVYDSFVKGTVSGPILSSAEELESLLPSEGGPKHILDLLRCVLIPSSPWEIPSNQSYLKLACNASQLKSAGIKFQKKKNASNLFDIHFDTEKGVLTIPTIEMFDETEFLLRNLIAFEQGKPATCRYFAALADFMDSLIDTDRDVALLTEKGIIKNGLGSPEVLAAIFNNIGKGVLVGPYFSGVVKDLNGYYNKSWNKWMANLRQTYFNSPWAGISVAAAVLVIILAIIQTICSLLQI